jgi:hypothetical protein
MVGGGARDGALSKAVGYPLAEQVEDEARRERRLPSRPLSRLHLGEAVRPEELLGCLAHGL